MSTLDSNCWALMKMGGDKGSAYYPETLGKLVIVNAPSFFTMMFGMVKSFVNEKTRRNFFILGDDYREQLLELIDADQLPAFLGGSCRDCDNVEGGCMYSDKGPW